MTMFGTDNGRALGAGYSMGKDEALEAAIDKVGRGNVFAYAEKLGWRHAETPPKWVWWGIVAELSAAKST